MITSYERGEVDPPATMLFLIWKSGNSIDSVFSEGPITEEGKRGAIALYDKCSFAGLKRLDNGKIDRLGRDLEDAKTLHNGTDKEITPKTSGKRKTSPGKESTTKKR
jgi:hypothetical protein